MPRPSKDPKITATTLKVLHMFLESHPNPLAGSDIFNKTKMFSGTLYPILGRLETAGWLNGEWESLDPSEAGRPRRRLYSLTGLGRRRAEQELSVFQSAKIQSKAPIGRKARGAFPSWI